MEAARQGTLAAPEEAVISGFPASKAALAASFFDRSADSLAARAPGFRSPEAVSWDEVDLI